MNKTVRILFGVVAVLCVSSVVFAQQWSGTYLTTINDADVPPEMKAAVGKWVLILGDEGQYSASQNGEVVVRGTYTVAADQMTFSDSEGTMACSKEQASGSYQPALDGATLTIKLVDDNCAGRRIILTSHPLTKQATN